MYLSMCIYNRLEITRIMIDEGSTINLLPLRMLKHLVACVEWLHDEDPKEEYAQMYKELALGFQKST